MSKPHELQRIWRICGALPIKRMGQVAAAASVAAACEGYAAPMRVPINEVVSGSSKSYDLDGDGASDVDVQSYPLLNKAGLQFAVGWGVGVDLTWNAFPFQAGELIPDSLPTNYSVLSFGLLAHNGAGTFYNLPSPRYAGFTFPDQALAAHWAWAELNVTSTYDVDVVAFGYETTPNTSIEAGVPEANGLASLAVGAAALLSARRRKRTA